MEGTDPCEPEVVTRAPLSGAQAAAPTHGHPTPAPRGRGAGEGVRRGGEGTRGAFPFQMVPVVPPSGDQPQVTSQWIRVVPAPPPVRLVQRPLWWSQAVGFGARLPNARISPRQAPGRERSLPRRN
jgi:hypothetical protein